MTKNGRYFRARKVICLALVCLTAVYGGCGQEQAGMQAEDVELLDPVGVAANYETAARRNLYDVKVYSALVCPYVEEYGLDDTIYFAAYDAYPGDEVKRGSTLLHSDTENIDSQIENMEETIADMEESYQEFLEENGEALQQSRSDQQYYTKVMNNLEKQKPKEFLTDSETGEVIQNPAYQNEYWAWYYGEWGYQRFERDLRNANQSVMELEEELKERTELYELDHAYYLLQLKRLKEDRSNGTLISEMAGYVAGLQFFNEGDWVVGDQPLMAVCDTSKVDIRCEYISWSEIQKAEDVYAIVDGKRYEVEGERIETEEYRKLKNQNGTVYSTFHVISGAEELEMGSYAAIVVNKRTRENAVTVPVDAVKRDGSIQYVYLVNGSEKVYTTVSTGVSDGMYTEILSGVQEGDKVLTDQALTADAATVTVVRGRVSNTFSESGYLYYPSTEWITNPVEYGTCYYEETLVVLYQQVKKGDVLARIRVVPDEAEIGRNVQRLVRERDRLEDLKKADGENEKAIAQMEESIRDLEELIADMRADAAVTEIKAPGNGIIIYIPRIEEQALLGRGAALFVLADESLSYVFVEDANGQLAYGNVAEIGYTDREGNQRQTTGDVVTLNQMSLSAGLVTDGALIRVSPEDIGDMAGSAMNPEGRWNRNRYRVTATIRSMDNVLLVPRSAVTVKNGRTYVKVRLESGEIQYRSFVAGGSDVSNYWVVEGLTEGMELCLK